MKKIKSLFDIFLTFFKLGFVSFGGGLAILKLYQDALVINKKYITEEELYNYYAISQTIPGIIIVNLALFIGKKMAGILGMFATITGVLIPPILVITLIATFFQKISTYAITGNFLNGINIAVSAVILMMTFELFKKNVNSFIGIVIAAASFIAIFFFEIPIYIIVLITIFVSLFIPTKEEGTKV